MKRTCSMLAAALAATAFAYAQSDSLVGCRLLTVASNDANLRTIDGATGATLSSVAMTSAAGTITGAVGLAQGPNSVLFVLLKLQGLPNRFLATVDPGTGVATSIGDLGDKFSSITFVPDGRLYGVTGDGATVEETLFEIDPASAATTLIAEIGIGDDGEVIVWDPVAKGLLHASGNGPLNDPVEGENLSVLFPDKLKLKTRKLSGFATSEITAMLPLPGGAILCANINDHLVTIDRKGFITDGPVLGFSNARGLVPVAPFGAHASGKVAIKLDFARSDSDSVKVQLQGLELGSGFQAAGATVQLEVGNEASDPLTLDANGRLTTEDGAVQMKQDARDGTWSFSLSASGIDLQDLQTLGFVNADTLVRIPLCVRFLSGGITAEGLFLVTYKAKAGKSGSAK